MDGARLGADEVKQVSKWPSREEQLSMLLGPDPRRRAPSWPASCISAGGALGQPDQAEGRRRRRAGAAKRRRGRGTLAESSRRLRPRLQLGLRYEPNIDKCRGLSPDLEYSIDPVGRRARAAAPAK